MNPTDPFNPSANSTVELLSPDGTVLGGQHPNLSFHTDDEIASGLPDRLITQARESGRTVAQLSRQDADGVTHSFEVSVTALRDTSGNLIGFSRTATEVAPFEPRIQFLWDAVTSAGIAAAQVSQDGRFLATNPLACEILGYQQLSLATLNLNDLVLEDDHSKPIIGVDGNGQQTERRIRRHDGSVAWVLLTVLRFELAGAPPCYVCQFQDISARKKGEQRNELIISTLGKVTSNAGINIWEYSIRDGVSFWSDTEIEVFGSPDGLSTSEEALNWQRYIDPDDIARVAGEIQHALTSDGHYKTEFRLNLPNGEVRQYQLAGSVMHDAAGSRVIGISWDATEERRAEAAQIKTLERLKLAIDAGKYGIWELDLDTGVRWWDERTRELFNVDIEYPTLEDHAAWLSTVHPDDRDAIRNGLQTLVAGAEHHVIAGRMVLPDGGTRYLRGVFNLHRDETGKPRRVIGIVADETATKLVEIERALLIERMKLALEGGKMSVWEIDLDSKRLEWDPRMLQLAPERPEISNSFENEWLQRIHPEDQSYILNSLARLWPGMHLAHSKHEQSNGMEKFAMLKTTRQRSAIQMEGLSAS